MTYRLANEETGETLKTDADDEALYRHAQDQGLMRPADWDEGGRGYYVLMEPYVIEPAV